jgi:hypothetical protein
MLGIHNRQCDGSDSESITVTPLVYILACFTFLGSVIFSTLGGIGLISLPLDFIHVFVTRPKPITSAEYERRKSTIGERAALLNEDGDAIMEELSGKKLGWKASRKLQKRENEFRRDVLELEGLFNHLEDGYKRQGGNFLVQIASLCFGTLSYVLIILTIVRS